MAHHKSALKRIRQAEKLRLYNRGNKKKVKEAIKAVKACDSYEEAMAKFTEATSILDKAAVRRIYHKNNIANKKSKLASFVKSLKKD